MPQRYISSEKDARRFAKTLNKKLGTHFSFEEWRIKLDSLVPFDASELVENMERTSNSRLRRFLTGK